MMAVQTIALTDLPQQLHSCFTAALSGDLICITDADQEAILISKENFLLIVDCLQRYQQLIDS